MPKATSRLEVGQVDLLTLLRIFWQERIPLLIILAIVGASSLMFLQFRVPMFEAKVTVASAESDSSGGFSEMAAKLGGLGGLGVGNFKEPGVTQTDLVLAQLRSRRFIETFIRSQNIEQDIVSVKDWRFGEAPKLKGIDFQSVYLKFVTQLLQVHEQGDSGIYEIGVRYPDAGVAAERANALIKSLNIYVKSEQLKYIEANLAYLQKQLSDGQADELRQALYQLLEDQLKKKMLLSSTDDVAFQIIDPAYTAVSPVVPKKRIVFSVGFGAFLLIGFAYVFAKRLRI